MSHSFDFDRYDRIRPIRWDGQALELLNQRMLPANLTYQRCESSSQVAAAIHSLTVRGAPAIGRRLGHGAGRTRSDRRQWR